MGEAIATITFTDDDSAVFERRGCGLAGSVRGAPFPHTSRRAPRRGLFRTLTEARVESVAAGAPRRSA